MLHTQLSYIEEKSYFRWRSVFRPFDINEKKKKFNLLLVARGSEFSSYEIELRIRVTQNDVTLRVTNL